jgi:hypothetical protein
MNQELEHLIDMAIADGTLTEKKKEILTRKAKELNVDQDEFELVLEGKMALKQKELQTQAQAQVPPIMQTPVQPAQPPKTVGNTINTVISDVSKVETGVSLIKGLKNMLGL